MEKDFSKFSELIATIERKNQDHSNLHNNQNALNEKFEKMMLHRESLLRKEMNQKFDELEKKVSQKNKQVLE